jgi:phosphohistidine swiveling domain-containing protein
MAGRAWFLDDEPSTRFPVYCRGNVGEIVPNVATPLSSSVTTEAFRLAFDELFTMAGAFTAAELAEPAVTGGLFGGYLYFNLSFARSFAARAPGMRVADVDQQMFGAGDAPAFRPGPGDRNVVNMARAGAGITRMVFGRTRADLDAARAATLRWSSSIPDDPDDDAIVALARGFAPRMAGELRTLLEASFGAAIPTSILERLAARAEADEPGLLVAAMSGLGDIETTTPARLLWRMGRMAAADEPVTALFDGGVAGLPDRMREAAGVDPSAAAFLAEFDSFLRDHGHRGPNEVELASDTWASDPESALAVVERLRFTDEAADPVRAGARLASERRAAQEQLASSLPAPLRPVVTRLFAQAARGTARREQAKGTIVHGVAALRRPLFRRAEGFVRQGRLPDRTQFFMATLDELPLLLADPESLASELAARRERYDELNQRVPPFAFDGHLPDPSTWPRRSDPLPPVDDAGRELVGIGVSGGIARGRARVVTDPADPRGLEPGEILVAPLTDPAWTPLFLAAAAVVVDVGALQSHAAIVARELGVPAVVSVELASKRIRDGDELEVDGSRGTVRVLSRRDG